MSTTKDKSGDSVEYEVLPNESKKVRFYIPTTKPEADDVIDRVIHRLASLFGGATQLPGKGAYVMNDGELCVEPVTIVESFGADMEPREMTKLALGIKESLDEEAVAFEIENIESALI